MGRCFNNSFTILEIISFYIPRQWGNKTKITATLAKVFAILTTHTAYVTDILLSTEAGNMITHVLILLYI